MLSLGQVTPIVSETDHVKRFKPWWEYAADYTSHFLLWLGLIAWTNVLNDSASGVRCVHQNKTSWSTIHAQYCSQKCSLELYNGVMVHYPYTIFLQWLIFFFNQIFWLKLPFVCSKLEAVNKMAQDMINLAGKKTKSQKTQKIKFNFSAETAHVKFLLQDFPTCNISEVYHVKSLFSAVISLVSGVFIVKAFPTFPRLLDERNTVCRVASELRNPYGTSRVANCPILLCHLGSGRFVYGLIVANLFVLVVFFCMSLLSFYLMRSKRKHINSLFPSFVKEHQGWQDICFAFCLMNIDLNNNNSLLRTIRKCMKDCRVDEKENFNEETPFNV